MPHEVVVFSDEDVDKEEVYRMANVMAECGGLDVMLLRYFLVIFFSPIVFTK